MWRLFVFYVGTIYSYRRFSYPKKESKMSNPVGWFELYVEDMSRAKAFYQSVFETLLEQISVPGEGALEMWAFPSDMQGYGAGGALVKMPGIQPGSNSTLVYFSCEDCAVEQLRVVPAGGKVQRAKMSIGDYGFIALVTDTEGNMFGLHSLK